MQPSPQLTDLLLSSLYSYSCWNYLIPSIDSCIKLYEFKDGLDYFFCISRQSSTFWWSQKNQFQRSTSWRKLTFHCWNTWKKEGNMSPRQWGELHKIWNMSESSKRTLRRFINECFQVFFPFWQISNLYMITENLVTSQTQNVSLTQYFHAS